MGTRHSTNTSSIAPCRSRSLSTDVHNQGHTRFPCVAADDGYLDFVGILECAGECVFGHLPSIVARLPPSLDFGKGWRVSAGMKKTARGRSWCDHPLFEDSRWCRCVDRLLRG